MKKLIVAVMTAVAMMLAVTGCGSRSDFDPAITVNSVMVDKNKTSVPVLSETAVGCAVSAYNGPVSYKWTATSGSFIGSGSNVFYVAPNVKGDYKITCEATDADNNSAAGSATISVVPIWKLSEWSVCDYIAAEGRYYCTGAGGITSVLYAGNSFYYVGRDDNKKLKVEKHLTSNPDKKAEWTYIAKDISCEFGPCGGEAEVNADGSVSLYAFGHGDKGSWNSFNDHDLTIRAMELSDADGSVKLNVEQDLVYRDFSSERPLSISVTPSYVILICDDAGYNNYNVARFRWLKIDRVSGNIVQTVDNIFGVDGVTVVADDFQTYVGGYQFGKIGVTAVDNATGTMVWQDVTDHVSPGAYGLDYEVNEQVALYNNELVLAGRVQVPNTNADLNLEKRNLVNGSLIKSATITGYGMLTEGMWVDETGIYLVGKNNINPGNWAVAMFDHNLNLVWTNVYTGKNDGTELSIAISIVKVGNHVYVSGFTPADGWHIKRLNAATGKEE